MTIKVVGRINVDLNIMLMQKAYYTAARYSKINLDIALSCHNFQDNNRYNIYIQFSIQYQDGVNVKNLVLP